MLDQLKRLSEEAGRDYASLELTAMSEKAIVITDEIQMRSRLPFSDTDEPGHDTALP